MELLWATADLVLGGHPRAGFPILLWDNMESCVEANEFFQHYLMRGSIGSRNSWPSTGRALYDYFSFLQVNDLSWKDVQRGEYKTLLAGYRDYSFDVPKLARNTIRQRLYYVCKFYEFAYSRGWVGCLPFAYEDRVVHKARGVLAHVDASSGKVGSADVMPRLHRDQPKFLSRDQVMALLAAATNPHHQMLIRVALQTGLRREELATFPLAYVFDPERSGRNERNLRISLRPHDGHGMKTKGMRARDIYVGRSLLKDLYRYAVQLRGERSSWSSTVERPLFLNQFGRPFSDGGKHIDRIVRMIGVRAGIKVHTHMLRHTYATHTLSALQNRRNVNAVEPLVFVQNQLGHVSINTTMIYLHLINAIADRAVLAYDDELNDWAIAL